MAHYGTTQRTDDESRGLLNNNDDQVQVTLVGRTFRHVHHHRKRYFALWLFAAVVAISAVVGLHYYHLHDKDTTPTPTPTPGPGTPDGGEAGFMSEVLLKTGAHHPDVCQSDRSYPIAILLSIFFGYVGVDRFYLGYVISALLKLATAGGFGIWYIVDILLIILGRLPDHNGCSLVAP
ncbi:hypothetical protein EMPS_10500 [Entomortierella parvispora]|uniref:TM2 domain-containing protein n=1 Tax=Entomortierella parvispora TaxID=205924 RepID=A0A9P3HK91_9FUNG|nr:hypothetical protein EMPS_10500 [Entomortierella parvispora]